MSISGVKSVSNDVRGAVLECERGCLERAYDVRLYGSRVEICGVRRKGGFPETEVARGDRVVCVGREVARCGRICNRIRMMCACDEPADKQC